MNKTKIEWCDYTWNPVTGCKQNCWYCYARRMEKRFGWPREPMLREERLAEPMKAPAGSRIFVCSVSDLLGPWVPDDWVRAVLRVIRERPDVTFMFLTKYPWFYALYKWPSNAWLGQTVTQGVASVVRQQDSVKFVSCEPLFGPVGLAGVDLDWIIVGALTGPGAKEHRPRAVLVEAIIHYARAHGIPLFLKDNLNWPERIREFPGARI